MRKLFFEYNTSICLAFMTASIYWGLKLDNYLWVLESIVWFCLSFYSFLRYSEEKKKEQENEKN